MRLTGAAACDPMDILGHMRLEELVGDLTVTAFLILLAASIVVVSSMVVSSLIEVAFQKKSKAVGPHRATLGRGDADWLTRNPWLALRANISQREPLNHSGFGRGTVVLVAEQFSEAKYWTPLIKHTESAIRAVAMKERYLASQTSTSTTSTATPATGTVEAA